MEQKRERSGPALQLWVRSLSFYLLGLWLPHLSKGLGARLQDLEYSVSCKTRLTSGVHNTRQPIQVASEVGCDFHHGVCLPQWERSHQSKRALWQWNQLCSLNQSFLLSSLRNLMLTLIALQTYMSLSLLQEVFEYIWWKVDPLLSMASIPSDSSISCNMQLVPCLSPNLIHQWLPKGLFSLY